MDIEEVVGPLNGVTQRLVSFKATSPPGKQPEAVAEPIAYLGGPHGHHSRGRKFDCERDAIKTAADLGDGEGVSLPVDRESRRNCTGAFHE